MSKKHLMLSESSLDGPRTRLDVVMAAECPALKAHHIAHVGIVDAIDRYERVRTRPDGSFVLACFAGEGRILLDGRWQRCTAGTICLAPPRVPDAFHAVKGKRWAFAYVRYHEPAAQKPVVNAASPVRVKSDSEPLRLAVAGLFREMHGAREARLMHHWSELIHGYALRVAQPWQVNTRLWRLWESVGKELAAEWTLGKLAALAHFSNEHLRRLFDSAHIYRMDFAFSHEQVAEITASADRFADTSPGEWSAAARKRRASSSNRTCPVSST